MVLGQSVHFNEPHSSMWLATREFLMRGWYDSAFERESINTPNFESAYEYLCDSYNQWDIDIKTFKTYATATQVRVAHWCYIGDSDSGL
jgi:hypothetical protein